MTLSLIIDMNMPDVIFARFSSLGSLRAYSRRRLLTMRPVRIQGARRLDSMRGWAGDYQARGRSAARISSFFRISCQECIASIARCLVPLFLYRLFASTIIAPA
jgi:hypothetical protein